jgi:hypothetical protein
MSGVIAEVVIESSGHESLDIKFATDLRYFAIKVKIPIDDGHLVLTLAVNVEASSVIAVINLSCTCKNQLFRS